MHSSGRSRAYFDALWHTDACHHPGSGRGDSEGSPENGGSRGGPARASAAGDCPSPPLRRSGRGERLLRPLPASADRPRPGKSCLRVRRLVGVSLKFAASVPSVDRPRPTSSKSCRRVRRLVGVSPKIAASVPCTQTLVSPPHLRQRQPAGRAVLHSRAKSMRFVAAASAPPADRPF